MTGKLRDGMAVKALQPLCWFEYYLGAPSLFVEKGGDKRANVALFAGAGELNDDIGIYEYESVVAFYSAEGVSEGKFNPFDTVSILGRCEVKPASGASTVVTARLKPEIE